MTHVAPFFEKHEFPEPHAHGGQRWSTARHLKAMEIDQHPYNLVPKGLALLVSAHAVHTD
ncbi:hypothetical protein COMA2_100086 [Candidatus Nitrospira nitrificans]|uniref:Uncharacterized protein n=1 Tax=Candidatus Nitrospira nitrificans TaxID=1742973 RepID=A0A0S4L438_9BACT|nr:hypothetical protein COMA2_100086 [Candidatus Nitrospira nitrificans]